MAYQVTLPWPPKELSPNARTHWRVKARITKEYRERCAWLCKEAQLSAPETSGRLHLWISFYPPDKRARDDDNMAGAFKAGRDGIADALGIDDKRFISHPYNTEQIGGMVKVVLTAGINAKPE